MGGFSPGFYSSSLSTIPFSAELASEEGGNCNRVTFGAESSRSRSHVTTTNLSPPHPVGLPSYCLVLPHLRHRVSGTSTYKLEGYSIGQIPGMIRDDKGEQKSDDEDLGE